jgi:hypothetical protein
MPFRARMSSLGGRRGKAGAARTSRHAPAHTSFGATHSEWS